MAQLNPLMAGREFMAGQAFRDQRDESKLSRMVREQQANQQQQLFDLQMQKEKQGMSRDQFKNDLLGLGLLGAAIKDANPQNMAEVEQTYNMMIPRLKEAGFDVTGAETFSPDILPVLGRTYNVAKSAGLLDDPNNIPASMREHQGYVNTIKGGALDESGNLKPLDQLTAEQRAAANKLGLTPRETGSADITTALMGLTQPVADSNRSIKTSEAAGTAEGKGEEERAQDLINRGVAAAESTATIRRAIDLLRLVETGGYDAAALRAKQIFGVESANEGELSNSLGKAVLSQLRETFGAAFTQEEGARLERIEASFGKSTAANERLLKQALRIAERTASRARKAAEARGDAMTVEDIDDLLSFTLDAEQDSPRAANPSGASYQSEEEEMSALREKLGL